MHSAGMPQGSEWWKGAHWAWSPQWTIGSPACLPARLPQAYAAGPRPARPSACPPARLQVDGDAQEVAEYTAPKPRDAAYEPSTLPGARLPHRALRLVQQGTLAFPPGAAPTSTVDLTAAAGAGSLLLLLAGGPWLGAWLEAAAHVQAATGVTIHPVVRLVGLSCEQLPPEGSGAAVVEEQAWEGEDAAAGGWYWAHDLGPDSALLVRPDGHIAWRQRHLPPVAQGGDGAAGAAASALEAAVRRVFCQS